MQTRQIHRQIHTDTLTVTRIKYQAHRQTTDRQTHTHTHIHRHKHTDGHTHTYTGTNT